MSDTFRRFRNHPIYTMVGAIYAVVLIGLASLVWLGTLLRLSKGQPLPPNMGVALTVVSLMAGWYLNFMTVCYRLRRLAPEAYARATIDMGFIAFLFSGRSTPLRLHNALAGLDLDEFPTTFRYHVRFTLLLNLILLWGFVAVVLGAVAMSLLSKYHGPQ